MFSPVVYPQPSPPPPQPSVRELAAAGYFRALALWLNEPLTPQGIFVKVQADRPGCLRLTVEFQRPPIKERLLRFLCHRVWVLNSELIEGIQVVARPVGWRQIAWQKKIRIVTPALKQRKASMQKATSPQQRSPLPPNIRRNVAHLSQQNLKTLRSFLLTGSAVAAFIFGCLLEVLTSGASPMLPSFSSGASRPAAIEEANNAAGSPGLGDDLQATTIDYRAANQQASGDTPGASQRDTLAVARPTVIDAALEPVGVIQHHLPQDNTSDDVTLLFGGDVSLDNLPYDALQEAGGLFTEVEEYLQADLSMVTLGSPLATAATTLEEELYARNRPDAVNLLAESGVDIVNLTNDNLMEYGTQGLDETLQALDSKGLYRVGAGRNETEARRPEVIDVKGKRIAYLSYSMGGDNSAFEDRAGTNAQDMKEIVEDIQALRDEVDWIVVNYRWMDFLSKEPNFKQTNLARMAIEQGADVVVGYHPNVIQGAEIYKGRPIAYSVGDFVFETDNPIADQESAMLKVSLKQDQMKVEFVPVRVQDSLPKTLEGPEGEAVLQEIEQASRQFEKPMKSPMVLDLKDKAPVAPEEYDPDSPFASPEEAETLTVPAEDSTNAEDALIPAEPETPEAEVTDFKAAPAEQDTEPSEVTPQHQNDKPIPKELDLMEQIEDLNQWGPKPSDGQQEFQPIPQNLRDSQKEDIDAQVSPGLRQLLQQQSQDAQNTNHALAVPAPPPDEPRNPAAAVDTSSEPVAVAPSEETEVVAAAPSAPQSEPHMVTTDDETATEPVQSLVSALPQKPAVNPAKPSSLVSQLPSQAPLAEQSLEAATLSQGRSSEQP
jgi:poly-gamma-glutamate synthesis protein (capsule biosynthesis protein)